MDQQIWCFWKKVEQIYPSNISSFIRTQFHRQFEEKTTKVNLVIGKTGSGKSSFINSLMGIPALLQDSVEPATKQLFSIRNVPSQKNPILYEIEHDQNDQQRDWNKKTLRENDNRRIKEFIKEANQIQDDDNKVRLFLIEIGMPEFGNHDFIILDTPDSCSMTGRFDLMLGILQKMRLGQVFHVRSYQQIQYQQVDENDKSIDFLKSSGNYRSKNLLIVSHCDLLLNDIDEESEKDSNQSIYQELANIEKIIEQNYIKQINKEEQKEEQKQIKPKVYDEIAFFSSNLKNQPPSQLIKLKQINQECIKKLNQVYQQKFSLKSNQPSFLEILEQLSNPSPLQRDNKDTLYQQEIQIRIKEKFQCKKNQLITRFNQQTKLFETNNDLKEQVLNDLTTFIQNLVDDDLEEYVEIIVNLLSSSQTATQIFLILLNKDSENPLELVQQFNSITYDNEQQSEILNQRKFRLVLQLFQELFQVSYLVLEGE